MGRELPHGWKVRERLDDDRGTASDLYAVGYLVENADGSTAYMKAHDYARAINHSISDFSRILQDMLSAYNFEKDLNEHCTNAGMSRVVHVLDAGALAVEGTEIPVNYLIFELAAGDVRHHLADMDSGDVAWKLHTIHQVGVGLSQLHRAGVVHRNLMPSTVMDFGEVGRKVGQLGYAWRRGQMSPLTADEFAGDPEYAPPECLYGFELAEVEARLKARDLYMFGSVILYLFSGVSATCALLTALPYGHHPGATAASFEQALPHLTEASDKVVQQLREHLDDDHSGIAERFRELCNPDPRRRGRSVSGMKYADPYSLESYISYFDHLAKRVSAKQPTLT